MNNLHSEIRSLQKLERFLNTDSTDGEDESTAQQRRVHSTSRNTENRPRTQNRSLPPTNSLPPSGVESGAASTKTTITTARHEVPSLDLTAPSSARTYDSSSCSSESSSRASLASTRSLASGDSDTASTKAHRLALAEFACRQNSQVCASLRTKLEMRRHAIEQKLNRLDSLCRRRHLSERSSQRDGRSDSARVDGRTGVQSESYLTESVASSLTSETGSPGEATKSLSTKSLDRPSARMRSRVSGNVVLSRPKTAFDSAVRTLTGFHKSDNTNDYGNDKVDYNIPVSSGAIPYRPKIFTNQTSTYRVSMLKTSSLADTTTVDLNPVDNSVKDDYVQDASRIMDANCKNNEIDNNLSRNYEYTRRTKIYSRKLPIDIQSSIDDKQTSSSNREITGKTLSNEVDYQINMIKGKQHRIGRNKYSQTMGGDGLPDKESPKRSRRVQQDESRRATSRSVATNFGASDEQKGAEVCGQRTLDLAGRACVKAMRRCYRSLPSLLSAQPRTERVRVAAADEGHCQFCSLTVCKSALRPLSARTAAVYQQGTRACAKCVRLLRSCTVPACDSISRSKSSEDWTRAAANCRRSHNCGARKGILKFSRPMHCTSHSDSVCLSGFDQPIDSCRSDSELDHIDSLSRKSHLRFVSRSLSPSSFLATQCNNTSDQALADDRHASQFTNEKCVSATFSLNSENSQSATDNSILSSYIDVDSTGHDPSGHTIDASGRTISKSLPFSFRSNSRSHVRSRDDTCVTDNTYHLQSRSGRPDSNKSASMDYSTNVSDGRRFVNENTASFSLMRVSNKSYADSINRTHKAQECEDFIMRVKRHMNDSSANRRHLGTMRHTCNQSRRGISSPASIGSGHNVSQDDDTIKNSNYTKCSVNNEIANEPQTKYSKDLRPVFEASQLPYSSKYSESILSKMTSSAISAQKEEDVDGFGNNDFTTLPTVSRRSLNDIKVCFDLRRHEHIRRKLIDTSSSEPSFDFSHRDLIDNYTNINKSKHSTNIFSENVNISSARTASIRSKPSDKHSLSKCVGTSNSFLDGGTSNAKTAPRSPHKQVLSKCVGTSVNFSDKEASNLEASLINSSSKTAPKSPHKQALSKCVGTSAISLDEEASNFKYSSFKMSLPKTASKSSPKTAPKSPPKHFLSKCVGTSNSLLDETSSNAKISPLTVAKTSKKVSERMARAMEGNRSGLSHYEVILSRRAVDAAISPICSTSTLHREKTNGVAEKSTHSAVMRYPSRGKDADIAEIQHAGAKDKHAVDAAAVYESACTQLSNMINKHNSDPSHNDHMMVQPGMPNLPAFGWPLFNNCRCPLTQLQLNAASCLVPLCPNQAAASHRCCGCCHARDDCCHVHASSPRVKSQRSRNGHVSARRRTRRSDQSSSVTSHDGCLSECDRIYGGRNRPENSGGGSISSSHHRDPSDAPGTSGGAAHHTRRGGCARTTTITARASLGSNRTRRANDKSQQDYSMSSSKENNARSDNELNIPKGKKTIVISKKRVKSNKLKITYQPRSCAYFLSIPRTNKKRKDPTTAASGNAHTGSIHSDLSRPAHFEDSGCDPRTCSRVLPEIRLDTKLDLAMPKSRLQSLPSRADDIISIDGKTAGNTRELGEPSRYEVLSLQAALEERRPDYIQNTKVREQYLHRLRDTRLRHRRDVTRALSQLQRSRQARHPDLALGAVCSQSEWERVRSVLQPQGVSRAFNYRDMRHYTAHKYKQLPEVRRYRKYVRTQNQLRNNRLIWHAYRDKLQEKCLKGYLDYTHADYVLG